MVTGVRRPLHSVQSSIVWPSGIARIRIIARPATARVDCSLQSGRCLGMVQPIGRSLSLTLVRGTTSMWDIHYRTRGNLNL